MSEEMKLAEALALRADAAKRIEQLRTRIVANARYQEGEPPSEDAAELLTEAGTVLTELEALIRRINRTNAQTPFGDGTVTDALARRDMLRLRHSVLTGAADAAAGRGQGMGRQLRSELRQLAALSVAELREQADRVALELRHLDIDIQRTNWEADLLH
ncbi:DIP1984 family protein [Amycolatopsis sp. NPDC005232]|uniref:DIP1984 family protein n=1 Tax=Amycolatopsis sp. NPDC005232 TaxID=3157027 RepID=UPI00339EBA25